MEKKHQNKTRDVPSENALSIRAEILKMREYRKAIIDLEANLKNNVSALEKSYEEKKVLYINQLKENYAIREKLQNISHEKVVKYNKYKELIELAKKNEELYTSTTKFFDFVDDEKNKLKQQSEKQAKLFSNATSKLETELQQKEAIKMELQEDIKKQKDNHTKKQQEYDHALSKINSELNSKEIERNALNNRIEQTKSINKSCLHQITDTQSKIGILEQDCIKKQNSKDQIIMEKKSAENNFAVQKLTVVSAIEEAKYKLHELDQSIETLSRANQNQTKHNTYLTEINMRKEKELIDQQDAVEKLKQINNEYVEEQNELKEQLQKQAADFQKSIEVAKSNCTEEEHQLKNITEELEKEKISLNNINLEMNDLETTIAVLKIKRDSNLKDIASNKDDEIKLKNEIAKIESENELQHTLMVSNEKELSQKIEAKRQELTFLNNEISQVQNFYKQITDDISQELNDVMTYHKETTDTEMKIHTEKEQLLKNQIRLFKNRQNHAILQKDYLEQELKQQNENCSCQEFENNSGSSRELKTTRKKDDFDNSSGSSREGTSMTAIELLNLRKRKLQQIEIHHAKSHK